MKRTFTTVGYLVMALSFCNMTVAQEHTRLRTKAYPFLEISGLYNLNKNDVLRSDLNNKLSTHNSGGYSLGLGITMMKPKQKGLMFSISAGYKSGNENFVTKLTAHEEEIHYKSTIGALYFRPEVSFYFKVKEQSYINFGCYLEPGVVLKESMPEYQLNYSKSNTSSFNTLSSSTFYHWGINKESGNGFFMPVNLLGVSAAIARINSGTVIKMIKCRLFFEFDPLMELKNSAYAARSNRSAATIKYYEDNSTNRQVISTDYYVDKMMRLGLGIVLGL